LSSSDIGSTRTAALGYKGYRLEFRSYLNLDTRRWVPKVFIMRLTGPDHPWKMLTAYDDEKDTADAADVRALAMGRRWVDENAG
jgi:hypothetical protein